MDGIDRIPIHGAACSSSLSVPPSRRTESDVDPAGGECPVFPDPWGWARSPAVDIREVGIGRKQLLASSVVAGV